MFTTLLYFLPCLVSILWLFIFIMKKKTMRQKVYSLMLLIDTFYFATYAVYIFPSADYDLMVKMDAVCIPILLALLAVMVIYLNMHRVGGKYNVYQLLLFTPAVVFAAIVGLLYFILGFDYTARYAVAYDSGVIGPEFDNQLTKIYSFFVVEAISYVTTVFAIAIFWQCYKILKNNGYRPGNVARFLFCQKESTSSSVIAVLYIALLFVLMPFNTLGRTFMMQHALYGSIMTVMVAILKHLICHVEFYSQNQKVTISSLTHVLPEEEITLQEEEIEEQIIAEKTPAEVTPEAVTHSSNSGTIKSDLLLEKFQRLMEVEKVYQDDSLNMTTLAERLEVGRTTLSNMVNMHYGMPFRDLLNHYRIEAAKQFLLDNPTATQEEVALECGFKDASSLNRKFKELEGETPLMWLTQHNTSAS